VWLVAVIEGTGVKATGILEGVVRAVGTALQYSNLCSLGIRITSYAQCIMPSRWNKSNSPSSTDILWNHLIVLQASADIYNGYCYR
jgi:hypothetical protein